MTTSCWTRSTLRTEFGGRALERHERRFRSVASAPGRW